MNNSSFHTQKDNASFAFQSKKFSYRFHLHQHPYVQELMQQLIKDGVNDLQATDTEKNWQEAFFERLYQPNSNLVERPYPDNTLDFTPGNAYSIYNWELFFHIPLTVAIHLSKNQRFADAQHWFHYIFDPTDDNSENRTPERFWKVQPFQNTDVHKTEEILVNIVTNTDSKLRDDTIQSIEEWKNTPFHPYVIARYRQQTYMYKTVMAYLDNLIAWGDSLFRQDTSEAIDEALMLYVLAANILGPRPMSIPTKGKIKPQTYAGLRKKINEFGIDVETVAKFDSTPLPTANSGNSGQLSIVHSLGKTLYFCIPRNDKLLSYWDTVADRLFKIRNSRNIQGAFRQLALFDPPIDPGLLVKAAAAGLDIGAIINGLNQPLPLVRFTFLVQKAAEIAQEVKSLGNNLLSAMEKEDGETMALLRAKHERIVMEMVEHVKYGQLQEAIKSKEGLQQSLSLAAQRYTYYEQQLGKNPDEIKIPSLDEENCKFDKDKLDSLKFSANEPSMLLRPIKINIAQNLTSSGGKIISSHEMEERDKLNKAHSKEQAAAEDDRLGIRWSHIPDFSISYSTGINISFSSTLGGGSSISKELQHAARSNQSEASQFTIEANNAAKIDSYARREQDWVFQSNLANGEIMQVSKQLCAAQIREAVAEQELKNHRQQMKHAEEIEHFLNGDGLDKTGKKTNKALYAWIKREVKGLYSQCFQFAFDIARKAERALQHELGNQNLSYLQFGYLAGKEGLLAGEKLYLDIKRMEMAYHEQNQREYELTKHVSVLQIAPLKLIQLRMTGSCTLELPEAVFDMDGPGHYFRRIKTVAVSIPCITGPYASINCTLTLLNSSIRKTPVVGDKYKRSDAEDGRFSDYLGRLQSIVTSSAQNDTGLFETNLRDERYLPFENSGVISKWQLQLPANPSENEPAQFDYNTISDVILHIRYTAREGGGLLRKGAIANIQALIGNAQAPGSTRLFSVRHEFPSEWARFQKQPSGATSYPLTLKFSAEHYPFWSQGYLQDVKQINLFARSNTAMMIKVQYSEEAINLTKDTAQGNLWIGKLNGKSATLPKAINENLVFIFDNKELSDLWIAVTW